jgi:adenine-specific DNA methylase
MLKFIAECSDWDLAGDPKALSLMRELVCSAHPGTPPVVLDSFAGGGAIPLEALRLGCESYAFDLNPVAFVILKTMLDALPRHGTAIAAEYRQLAEEVRDLAATKLEGIYPPDPDGSVPIAYLWARTVRCESPNCGAEIPIFKSAWLSKRGAKKARYFRESPDGSCVIVNMTATPLGGPITFDILRGEGREQPAAGFSFIKATKASGNNSNVTCPCCGITLLGPRVMAQLSVQRGGSNPQLDELGRRLGGAYLLAVVVSQPDTRGKRFRLAKESDYVAVQAASRLYDESYRHVSFPPLNPTRPSPNARGMTAPTRYGVATFGDLFTRRQLVTLRVLGSSISSVCRARAASDQMLLALSLALGRCADQASAHVRWIASIEAIASTFSRQALQMIWDFVEGAPLGSVSANFLAAADWVLKVFATHSGLGMKAAEVSQADATSLPLPNESVSVFFTDPPYYDAVPYADLADFFLLWLKNCLPESIMRSLRLDPTTGLSPKAEECVWNRAHDADGQPKDPAFFEATIQKAFAEGRRALEESGVACVVFAHKSTEGWEALLSGLLTARWTITASWPIMTERGVRTNAQNTASLATSIHLICRPRTEDLTGDWGEVLRELPRRVGDWMDRLEREGVRGADLVFACIGPALEIFSRYARVETPDGTEKTLAEYLEKVWEVVGRVALEQVLGTTEAQARNGGAGALEEDARLTALFLWTVQATDDQPEDSDEDDEEETSEDEGEEATPGKKKPGFALIYDVARRFAQPLGIHLTEWEGRIIETKKGVVRLLPVRERSQQLFGEAGTELAADRIERVARGAEQLDLFSILGPVDAAVPEIAPKRGRKKAGVADEALKTRREATTLDRVHAAMLLQAGGQANALRSLLKSETERSPDFLRLANALSALYPKGSEEKRLLDAMLLAAPR